MLFPCIVALLTFLLLPFFIHFSSLIIEPPPSNYTTHNESTGKVVFITIDGLLWDSISAQRTPFLFSQIAAGGRQGYTFVRAPTESRPAHIALLAGFYEDPSSLYQRWQQNGRPGFDSVFTYTRSLAIGAPDVVPFFGKGSPLLRMITFPYDWYKTKVDVRELGTFVLRELQKTYLKESLVFCHLAAVDTAGHRHGSHSPQYHEAILHADSIIQSIVNHFKGHPVSFIVTSDHGFAPNSRGHDIDHPFTKKTPLLLFGHKLDRPDNTVAPPELHTDWEHVNVASLITALLNAPLPVNYVGDLRAMDILQLSDEKKRALLAIEQAKVINHRLMLTCNGHFGLLAYKYRRAASYFEESLGQLKGALEIQPESAGTVYKMVKELVVDVQGKSSKFQRRQLMPAALLIIVNAMNIAPFAIPGNALAVLVVLMLVLFVVQAVTPLLYLLAISAIIPMTFYPVSRKMFKVNRDQVIPILLEAGTIGIMFTPYALIFHYMAIVFNLRMSNANLNEYALPILLTLNAFMPVYISKWTVLFFLAWFLKRKDTPVKEIVPLIAFKTITIFTLPYLSIKWWQSTVLFTAILAVRFMQDRKDQAFYPHFFYFISNPQTACAIMLGLLLDNSFVELLWLSAFFPMRFELFFKVPTAYRQILQVLLTAGCVPFIHPNPITTCVFPLLAFLFISITDQQWKTMVILLVRHIVTSLYTIIITLWKHTITQWVVKTPQYVPV